MISYIITTQASKVPLDTLLLTLFSINDSVNDQIIVIDDSGKDLIPKGYYDNLTSVDEIIINDINYNSLYSRYLALSKVTNKFVRYIDVGDICINSDEFNKLVHSLDLNEETIYHFNQDNNYYSCLGDSLVNEKVHLAALSGLECSTVWTKIYPKSILEKAYYTVFNKYPKLNLFHLDDYLILNIALLYTKRIIQFGDKPYIHYKLGGESNSRVVSKQFYDKVTNDLSIVQSFIDELYGKEFRSISDVKIKSYLKRFTIE